MNIIEQIVALADERDHTEGYVHRKEGKFKYRKVAGAVTPEALAKHFDGGVPLGIYMCPDEKREKTHFLVFDFDDKKGRGIAQHPTIMVARHLEEMGVPHLIFRSGGGHGYHIWLFFENARRVDTIKKEAVEILSGVKEDKVKYVAVKEGNLNRIVFTKSGKRSHVEHGVEVLPKGTGQINVAIPCGRESVPMRLVRDGSTAWLEECSLDDLTFAYVPMKKPGPSKAEDSSDVDRDAAFEAFIQAFDVDVRSQWGAAGICLQAAFSKEDEWARDRWIEWSRTSALHEDGTDGEDHWDQLTSSNKYSPLSFWRMAKKHGYEGKWPFSASDRRKLLAIDFLNDVKILRDQADRAYAELKPRDFVEINSNEFKETVALALYRRDQELPDERMVKGAQMIASALARDTEPEEIALRFGKSDGKRYVFLADKERNIVEIDEDGWRINNDAPVQFRKGIGLPMSVKQGQLSELLGFLNVDEDSMVFLLAWMVSAIINPGGQSPIAILHGFAGSAKSSTLSTIVQVIDPKVGAQAGDPQSEEDLIVSAYQSAVLSFDNVRSLSKLSDPLCRISTGGGMSRRKKYSDGDVYALDAKRPVMIAGIDPTFYQQDLIERIIRVTLTKPSVYMDDEEFEAVRNEKLPRFRGALFDLVSKVLRDVHSVEQTTSRFGVFTRVGECVARHLGRDAGWFVEQYTAMRMSIALESSEADSVYQFLVHHLGGFDQEIGSTVRDSAGRLLMEMKDTLREAPIPVAMSDVPANARVMGLRIAECAGLLTKATGWSMRRVQRDFVFEKLYDVEADVDDVFEIAKQYAEGRDLASGIA